MSTAPEPHDVSTLRGPEVRQFGPRFWSVVLIVTAAVLAIIVIVGFISAVNENARIDRLKSRGISVTVTVTNCNGNIGGSGSNAAGYTCQGVYRLHNARYREVIGSKSTFSRTGSRVRCIADPAQPSRIELASAVATSSTSLSAYIFPSLSAVALIALSFFTGRRRRRFRATEPSDSIPE